MLLTCVDNVAPFGHLVITLICKAAAGTSPTRSRSRPCSDALILPPLRRRRGSNPLCEESELTFCVCRSVWQNATMTDGNLRRANISTRRPVTLNPELKHKLTHWLPLTKMPQLSSPVSRIWRSIIFGKAGKCESCREKHWWFGYKKKKKNLESEFGHVEKNSSLWSHWRTMWSAAPKVRSDCGWGAGSSSGGGSVCVVWSWGHIL